MVMYELDVVYASCTYVQRVSMIVRVLKQQLMSV